MGKITLYAGVLLLCLALSACGSLSGKLSSFEKKEIDTVKENEILVNCSEEVNRGKKGNIIDIGYLCSVKVDEATAIEDQAGRQLQFSELSQGDTVTVEFAKSVNIRKGHVAVQAAKIVRLKQADAQQ
ncbi:hypothetical protein [Paenibacillus montanisoli]|uniref:DUF3221 domain-containing protein n=1 Tax=Paenibacillus montanisoli TaxID=2081970 RepID=A0A328U4Z2_9BACL|nr:hypothetical protein [Paenibacillus montanisoli]RAP75094.1 hypothetical protein DL346_17050 [Paenibacillus montanisoli]